MRRRLRRPSRKALAAATGWQRPAGARIEWNEHEVAEISRFGEDVLRLRIAADGTVGRWLNHCGTHVRVVGEGYRPITCEPLTCEADARALLERVRNLAGT